MTMSQLSTIAQLLYRSTLPFNFAHVIGELEPVLTRLSGGRLSVTWDWDDFVSFELPGTRILLAVGETPGNGACLTVSAGPGEGDRSATDEVPAHDLFCSRLVERLSLRFPGDGVIWHQLPGTVDGETVDALSERLPDLARVVRRPPPPGTPEAARAAADFPGLLLRRSHLGTQVSDAEVVATVERMPPLPAMSRRGAQRPRNPRAVNDPAAAVAAIMAASAAVPVAEVAPVAVKTLPPLPPAPNSAPANDLPQVPRQRDLELARLRMALYPPPGEVVDTRPSTQMRLAAHAMNATLIVVWAPLGAAVMTYSCLKGEDMQLSARLMAVCGTIAGVMQTPMGQQVAAMANSLTGT